MSSVVCILGDGNPPQWRPWDGIVPKHAGRDFAWIDVVAGEDGEIAMLRSAFGLHELAIEDSMSGAQLAKVDLYPDHIFIIAKAAELGGREIEYAEVSIFLSERRVITISRTETAFAYRLREGLHQNPPHPLTGADFVVHATLDLITDNYLSVVQMIADEVLRMEKRLLEASLEQNDIARIFQLRRETIHFRHALTRMSEVCNKLANLDLPCISSAAKPYFRDVLDNLARVDAMSAGLVDVIRAALEASSLLEQQRQSVITRQLAAWAAILGIPTLIAGIEGMNFVNMPETRARSGYFIALAIMMGICALLYWRFRALGWLQPARGKTPRKSGSGTSARSE